MVIFPLVKELPEDFHALTLIRSVELKTKLAERIGRILKLLDFFHTVEPDTKTQVLVRGFLKYLMESCTDKDLINTRASWLLRYAGVVYDHLLTVRYGPVSTRENAKMSDDREFIELTDTLASTIGAYYSAPHVNQTIEYSSFVILQNILATAQQVNPDHQYQNYNQACEQIKNLTDTMIRLTKTKCVLTNDDDGFIERELRSIRFYIDQFVSHKGIPL